MSEVQYGFRLTSKGGQEVAADLDKVTAAQGRLKRQNEEAQRGTDATRDAAYAQAQALATAAKSSNELGTAHSRLGGQTAFVTREVRALFDELASGGDRQALGTANLLITRYFNLGLGAIAGLAGVAALAGGFIYSVVKAEELDRALAKISTGFAAVGNAGLLSQGQIRGYIDQLDRLPNVSREAAEQSLSALARVPNISGPLFDQATGIIGDFAVALGVDAPKAAALLAEAIRHPAEGAKKLDEQLNFLTASQRLTIDELDRQGRSAEAAGVLLDALGGRVKGLADNSLTPLQQAEKEVGRAWDDLMKSFGESKSIQLARDGVTDVLAVVKSTIKEVDLLTTAWDRFKQKAKEDYDRRTAELNGVPYIPASANQAGGGSQPAQSASTALGGGFDTKGLLARTASYASAAQQVKLLRDEETQLAAALTITDLADNERAAIQDRLAGVRERLAAATKQNVTFYDRELQSITASTNVLFAEIGATDKLTQSERKLIELKSNPEFLKLSDTQRKDLESRLTEIATIEKERASRTALDKVIGEQNREYEKSLDAIQKQIDAAKAEIEAHGKTGSALAEVTLHRLENQLAQANQIEVSDEYLKHLQNEIDKQKELVGALKGVEVTKAANKAAEETAKAFEREREHIANSLIDAILEGGKTGRDRLKQLFAQLVLRPILAPIANAAAGYVLNVLGYAGGDAGGGSVAGGGYGSYLTTAYSLSSGAGSTGSALASAFGNTSAVGPVAPIGSVISGEAPVAANSAGSAFGGAAAGAVGVAGGSFLGTKIASGIGGYDPDQQNYAAAGAIAGAYIGSVFPVVGTLVGGLIGGVLGGIVGAFADPGDTQRKGTFRQGASGTSYSGSSQFGNFGIANDSFFSDSEMGAQLKGFIGTLTTLDNAIASGLDGDQLAKVKGRLSNVTGDYNFGDEHTDVGGSGALGAIARDRYARVFEVINPGLAKLVANFQGTGADLETYIKGLAGLNASIKAGAPVIQEQKTLYDAWVETAQLTRGAIGQFVADGSLASLQRISELNALRYQQELQLVQQIADAVKSNADLFGGSIRNVKLNALDQQGKASFLKNEANTLYAQLGAASDPTQINQLAQKLNNTLNEAYNNAGPDNQKALAGQFADDFQRVLDLVTSRLNNIKQQIVFTNDENEASGSIAQQIKQAFDTIGKNGTASSAINLEAANTFAGAVNQLTGGGGNGSQPPVLGRFGLPVQPKSAVGYFGR